MAAEQNLRIGGVMRCCITTLGEYLDTLDEPAPVGTVLPCNWCSSGLIVADDGVWEWNRGD